jgi:hypothetical protein
MVNRSGVGPAYARVRGLVLLVLLVLGAAWLLRRDVATPHSPNLPASSSTQIQASLARLPISFEPNQGQSDTATKFVAHGRGYGLYLTPSAAVLTLPGGSQNDLRHLAVEMQLAGANQQPEMVGADRLPGHSNYFIGNDPSRWLRNIPQYGRVQYREVYPGIDLAFYGNQNQLEYDFEVSPGSDAHQIELNFKGAENVSVADNGDLVLGLDGRELRFEAPHVYQKFPAGTQTVAGSFVMRGKNSAGFELGPYDRSRVLVIDPVLAFASYLGGAGEESCTAISGASAGFVPHCPSITVDSGGRIYVAGATTSTGTFSGVTPTVLGTMGTADVFVSRISLGSSGGVTTSTLDYVTYIGGASGIQYPAGIGVDSGFNVYVAGTTNSSTYPTTPSAFQTAPASAGNHVFVSKIDSTGSLNDYSTYLSGGGVDTASNMAVDSQGRVYVIGTTTSPDLPTTIGALQAHPAATNQFFFAKLNPTLNTVNSLQYSTYIGGSTPANGVVVGGAVAVDASFNVYLAGGTNFTDMGTPQPWIANAFKSSLQGGLDVWAAKLKAPPANTQQYALAYGTYFGGTGDDVAYGVATDGTDTYLTGSTTSTDITVPNTTLAFQTANGGSGDAFVAKFGVPAISGTTQGTVPLDYFSYLGGSAQDAGLSVAADTLGNAYVTGLTAGSFHLANAFQGSFGGGAFDAFVARLNTTGTSTTASTSTSSYLGGSGKDIGTGIALDSSLKTYITGETAGTFPTTSPLTGGGSLSGLSDVFVAQLGPNTSALTILMPDPTPAGALPACNAKNPTVSPSPVGVGSPVTFTYYIYNLGDPVSGVVFTDQLGVNSSTSASTSQGTCGSAVTSGTLICTLGTVNSSTLTTLTTANSCGATQSVNFAAKVTVTVTAPTTVLQGSNSVGNTASLSFPGGTTVPISGSATLNDFSVSATLTSPGTGPSIPSGGQVNYSVLVTPTGSGFPESVAISCGAGLPAGSACSFPSPTGSTISSMSSGPQSRTLAISTTARVTTTGSLLKHGITYALWLPILGVGLMGAGVSRKRRVLFGVFFALLLGMALLQAGCSSSSTTRTTTGTPAGTYTVTVNATSGSATRTTTVQFTVE